MVFLCRRVGFFLRERKITATPCRKFFHAMRLEGCKVFCKFSFAKLLPLGITPSQLGVMRSLLCIFDDVPSSKELTLGLPQINLGILSLNRSFAFLHFCKNTC